MKKYLKILLQYYDSVEIAIQSTEISHESLDYVEIPVWNSNGIALNSM